MKIGSPVIRGRIKKMLVHPHEAGNHGLAPRIDHFRARRHVRACRGTRRSNFAVVDDDSLVRLRSRASAINQLDMRQCDHW
jgi:hypothetical protein